MLLWLVAVLVGIISFLYYYLVIKLELLRPVTVEKMSIPKCTLIYSAYQGNYHNLYPSIKAMKGDFEKFLGPASKSLKYFGIYYDNPKDLVDPNTGRAVIGAFLDDNQAGFEVEKFLEFSGKSLSYSVLRQAKTTGFGAVFPLHSKLNLFISVMRGYPQIMQWGEEHGLMAKSKCSLEIYDWHGRKMTVCFPYGKVAEGLLFLSGFEIPPYKK